MPAPPERAGRRRADRATIGARVFCLAVGPFLLFNGIAGLVFAGTATTVGDDLPHRRWNFLFEFNSWHQILHVATGALLVVAAMRRGWAPFGVLLFGAIYAVLAPAGFLAGPDVFGVIYSDTRDNLIHAALAAQALGLAVVSCPLRKVGSPTVYFARALR